MSYILTIYAAALPNVLTDSNSFAPKGVTIEVDKNGNVTGEFTRPRTQRRDLRVYPAQQIVYLNAGDKNPDSGFIAVRELTGFYAEIPVESYTIVNGKIIGVDENGVEHHADATTSYLVKYNVDEEEEKPAKKGKAAAGKKSPKKTEVEEDDEDEEEEKPSKKGGKKAGKPAKKPKASSSDEDDDDEWE